MNKAFIGLALILTLLAGCQSVKQERPPFIENHTYVNTDKFPHVSIHLFAPTIKDTLIDGQTYKVMVNDEGKTFIFRDNHLIFTHNDLPSAFDFIDFNEDGYLDILFTYASAQNEAYELLLFNPSRRDFIQIPDFNIQGGYPVKIKGTQYYYSYRPRGCADTCWGSDLFYFDHFKIVRVGNISVEVDKVKIYKIKDGRKVLISSYGNGMAIFSKYEHDKWGYIDAYWTKHYQKFISN